MGNNGVMRICDICGEVTRHLELLSEEFGETEVCDTCHRRLLDLFHDCEKEIALQRTGLRKAAIERWKQERSPKQNDAGPPG